MPLLQQLPLVAIAAFAIFLGLTWPTLPEAVSVHFSAGEPDRSISRTVFAVQSLLVLAMPPVTGLWLRRSMTTAPALVSLAVLAGVYGLTAATFTILWDIVRFNQQLAGPPRPLAAAVAALIGGAIGLALGARWHGGSRR